MQQTNIAWTRSGLNKIELSDIRTKHAGKQVPRGRRKKFTTATVAYGDYLLQEEREEEEKERVEEERVKGIAARKATRVKGIAARKATRVQSASDGSWAGASSGSRAGAGGGSRVEGEGGEGSWEIAQSNEALLPL